ncbi:MULTISPECIES: Rho termination factor N-terminal domain-containing protein [Bacillus cereus group]|uniref:Rho termination factor N-terminal domain-containing protein n=1 Tax=Bacillus cereus group TaxID=86661 RepID=UPI0024BD11BA|nr:MULTISPECIES: Rho termination factor N-terminal domain-containing protein [Bacillus cereus group]MED3396732.1 Rho termination factor N-terminal domain-containing protein [Bacillus wiedmannii]
MFKKILEIFQGSKSKADKPKADKPKEFQTIEVQKDIPNSSDKLDDARLEFLKYINKKDYTNLPDYWCEHIGDIDATISKFRHMGLLTQPNKIQMLETNTVKTLKEIAKSNGIKGYSKLKKAEVIDTLLQNISKEDIYQMHKDLTIYVLTPEGEKLVNDYKHKKDTERSELINHIGKCIEEKNLIKAAEAVIKYEQQQVFKRGLGIDWDTTEPNHLTNRCNEIFNLNFLDLDNTEEFKSQIKKHLIIGELLGEHIDEMTNRFLDETTEEIKCSSLDSFLKNPHGGYASRMKSSNNDKVRLYCHYALFKATNQQKLNNLLSIRAGDGIEILKAEEPEGCSICGSVKDVYLWKEVKDIPKLPLHFGCRCMYVAHFKM